MGTIGSVLLNGNAFDFIFSGDTENVYSVNYFLIGPTPVNPAISSAMSISGVASVTSPDLILVQNFVVSGAPNVQDNTTYSGFLTGVNPAAINWDLASSIGPLALTVVGSGGYLNTSVGPLTLTSVSNLGFTAIAASEPRFAGLLAFGFGIALLARLRSGRSPRGREASPAM